eukprot:3241414-Pyramimonas_sp.AAC.1
MAQAIKDMDEASRQNRELQKAALDLTCRAGYLETVVKACFSDQIKRQILNYPRSKRARTQEDCATRWRQNLEDTQWGPRRWSYYVKCWMYIAENNDEFVYSRDLQYNNRFHGWSPSTTWATYTTSFVGIDGRRIWDHRFYMTGTS